MSSWLLTTSRPQIWCSLSPWASSGRVPESCSCFNDDGVFEGEEKTLCWDQVALGKIGRPLIWIERSACLIPRDPLRRRQPHCLLCICPKPQKDIKLQTRNIWPCFESIIQWNASSVLTLCWTVEENSSTLEGWTGRIHDVDWSSALPPLIYLNYLLDTGVILAELIRLKTCFHLLGSLKGWLIVGFYSLAILEVKLTVVCSAEDGCALPTRRISFLHPKWVSKQQ